MPEPYGSRARAAFDTLAGDGLRPVVLLAIAALSLWIAFANYGFHGDLIGGDATAVMAFPQRAMYRLLGVYVPGPGLGTNGSIGIQAIFPLFALMVAFVKLGASSAVATRLFVAVLFFISMTGAFFLVELLCAPYVNRAWTLRGASAAALLFGANAFTVFAYSSAENTFTLTYAALPWILYGTIYGIERHAARGAAVIAAALVLAGGTTNQAQFVVACVVPFIGLLAKLIEGTNLKRAVAVTTFGLALGLLCCLWWIAPFPTVVHGAMQSVAAYDTTSWLFWMSERSSFAELFKLAGYTGELNLPYGQWYVRFGSVAGFMPLAAAIVAAGRFRSRLSTTFFVILLLAVALAKGEHAPFGGFYAFLVAHVPGFAMFRSAYDKWIVVAALMLSCLVGMAFATLGNIWAAGSPRIRRFASVAAIVLMTCIVAYPWTLYAGLALNPGAQNVRFISTIPKSYFDVVRFIDRFANGGRTVIFNSGSLPYALYSWGYFGEDPLIDATAASITPLDDIQTDAATLPVHRLAFMLKSFGVRFVVVHRDVTNPVDSPDIDRLVKAHDAVLRMHTPQLDLYEMKARPDPMVGVVHFPVFAQSTGQEPFIVGAPARGVDAQFSIGGERNPITLTAQRLVPREGRLTQLSPRNRQGTLRLRTPSGARLFFAAYNGGAAVWLPYRCSFTRGALITSPTAWTAGTVHLPFQRQTICLNGIVGNTAFYDGTPAISGQTQFTVAGVHHVRFNLLPKTLFVTIVRDGKKTVLRTIHGKRSSRIEVVAGNGLTAIRAHLSGGERLFASTSDEAHRVAASADITSRTLSTLLSFPSSGQTQDAFLTLQLADARARLNLGRVRQLIPASASNATVQIPPSRSIELHRRVEVAGWRQSNDARGLRPVFFSRWTRRDAAGVAFAKSAGGASTTSASGTLITTDAYAVDLRYVATGTARITVWLDGSYASATWDLVADGTPHRLRVYLYPPPSSNGAFKVSATVQNGSVALNDARMSDIGPNGTFFALTPGAVFGGEVISQQRLAAWHYRAVVKHCTPCVVVLQVADVQNWQVSGAKVLRSVEGPGAATGGRIISSGEALWALDAPTGAATVDFAYLPALLMRRALPYSVGGFIVVLALMLWPNAQRGTVCSVPNDAHLGVPLTASAATFACLALLVALAQTFGWQNGAETAATVLWFCLLLFAGLLWWRSIRGSVDAA